MNFYDEKEDEKEKQQPLDLNIIRTTLAENGYVLLRPIGKGGFGSVFLIFSNQYNLEFVVKVSNYKGSSKNNSSNANEFDLNEINNLINLIHPNIINMYKYFTDDHYLYIILEYCEGGSLQDLVADNGKIRPPLLFNYCHQILTALKHCHDIQIAHGDLKPANVLIDKNQRLKLADFGLSKGFTHKFYNSMDSENSNENDRSYGKNGEILIKEFDGSAPYMPPELIHLQAYDPFKADIWSLGVTFYQLATGHLPWNRHNPKEMRMSISYGVFSFQGMKLPSSFCNIIHRMIEVQPGKRATIDWLIEQPIFNQAPSVPLKKSTISKSPSIGSSMNSFKMSPNLQDERRIKLAKLCNRNRSSQNMLAYNSISSSDNQFNIASDGNTKQSGSDNLEVILEDADPSVKNLAAQQILKFKEIGHNSQKNGQFGGVNEYKNKRKIRQLKSNASAFPVMKTFF